MASVSIRRNDTVLVLSGKDKGKQGRVLSVSSATGRAVVENVATLKRHTRPNPQKGIKGGIVEREGSIAISNLKLVCPECNVATRVGKKRADDGSRARLCKKCNKVVDRKEEK